MINLIYPMLCRKLCRELKTLILGSIFLLLPVSLFAQFQPQSQLQALAPFQISYEASFRGFKATAERSLEDLSDNHYKMESIISLKLLWKTLSRITEQSQFNWENGNIISQSYHFTQTGLGRRSRSVEFDWDNSTARTVVNSEENILTLTPPILDELNSFIELRRQLAIGTRDIFFHAVDKNEIKEYHYRILGEEQISTPLGLFNTIRLVRVRAPESKRTTEIWLATDWDYILIKLFQETADGKTLELILKNAVQGDTPVTSLPSQAIIP